MPRNAPDIHTGVDRLLRHVRDEESVSLKKAAERLDVEKTVALGWASALQDAGFIDIHHSARHGRVLIAHETEEPEEDLDETRKDAAEDIRDIDRFHEERTDIEQFRELLERMEHALEEDEEVAEDLEDVMKGENLETLHAYVQDLKDAETDIEEMEATLDDVLAKLQVLSMVETEDDAEEPEKPSLLTRVAARLPWTEATFKCEQCGKEFSNQHGLDTHRGMMHHE